MMPVSGFAPPAARQPLCSLVLMVFMPFRIECLLSLRGPKVPRMLTFMALQLGGNPKQRPVDDGAIVIGQFNDACLDDKTAEFDQMSGALSALGLPRAHVMSSLG